MLQNNSKYMLVGMLATLVTTGANAQVDDESIEEPQLEEVVITGIRDSLRRAATLKRNSESIIDVITAEDVGKFPDENVAESLQRITGVQITRLRGEGQNATIRGLPSDFVQVRLNNVQLPNASRAVNLQDTSRSFDFTALPSEFVQTLEVHKSPEASLEEGGLAGSISVRTPKPFDFGRRVVSVSAQASNESNSEDVTPKVTAFYSDVFADGKFGFSIGVTASERDISTQQYRSFGFVSRTEGQGFLSGPDQQIGSFTGDGLNAALNASVCDGSLASQASCFGADFNGNGVLDEDQIGRIPNRETFDFIDERRERASAIISGQWRVNDNVELFSDIYYSELDVDAALQESLAFTQFSLGPFFPDESSQTLLEDGTVGFTRLRVDNVDLRHGNRIARREAETYSVTIGGKWESEVWTADAQLSVAESEEVADNLNLVTRAFFDVLDVTSIGADTPELTFLNGTEAIFTDPNRAQLLGVNGEFGQPSSDDLTDFQANFSRALNWGAVNKVKFGLQYSDREIFGGSTFLGISLDGLVSLVGEQGPATFLENQVGFSNTQSGAAFLLPVGPESGGFLDGQFPANRFIGNTEILDNFSREQLIAAGDFSENLNATEDVTEETVSAYLQFNFASEEQNLSGNFGLRLVHTDQTSRGVGADLNSISFTTNGNVTNIDSLGVINETRSYTEILPSFNLRLNLSEDVVLRAAANRTLARPSLTAISTVTNANFEGGAVITGGNPDLDPFIADNFDVSFEYYFGDSNLLSFTYFRKDLVSVIRPGSEQLLLPVDFLDENDNIERTDLINFTDTSPSNGLGLDIEGFEIGYQQAFTHLSGFLGRTGINANYTFVNNSDEQSLPAASENNFNFGVFYEDERFGAQVSFTWRDSFINEIAVFGNTNTEIEAFGTLDGSITYKVNDNFSIFMEGNNLADEREEETFVNGLARSLIDTGRRLTFGARASF